MPVELDRGHDEPIFGPDGQPHFDERRRAAMGEVALRYGRQARLAASRLDAQMREELAAYLVGRSSFDALVTWFTSVEPTATASVNPTARALARLLRTRLTDYVEARRTEVDLKRMLAPYAFLEVARDPTIPRVWTGSATTTVQLPPAAVLT
jgi:hypothetical protein